VGSTAVSAVDLSTGFSQDGPVWHFTPFELKSILREDHGADFGFTAEELAKRACYEFETWLPRVLSWHDYQYRCFWFFGGKDSNRDSTSKSFFSTDAEATWLISMGPPPDDSMEILNVWNSSNVPRKIKHTAR